jgi:4-carboxymuconolactone decarboxylase
VANQTNQAEERCREVLGQDAPENIKALFSEIYPQLSDYSINFIFGKIYEDSALTLIERELINIAALVVEGSQPQLENHILSAYRLGCPPKKILATIVQMVIIIGFPKVVNSVLLAQDLFRKHDVIIN